MGLLGEILGLVVSNPEDYKRDLLESVFRRARGAEPVAAAWRGASRPAEMLRLVERILGDRRSAVQLVRDAIASAPEPTVFLAFDRVLAAVQDEIDFVNIGAEFERLSPEQAGELAGAIRAYYTPPFNLSELLAHVDARNAADRAARRRIHFAAFYERCIEAPVPFAIPPDAVALDRIEIGDDELAVVMIGTPAARDHPILEQAQVGALSSRPVGYFLAGFWGHGVNSYAFYYCDVSPTRRIFLRIPFGGAYGDIVRERADVREILRRVAQLEIDAAHGTWTLAYSMGEGEFRWTTGGVTRQIEPTWRWSWDEVHRLVQDSRT